MGWITSIAIYFVIWWTVLFVVLPIGMRSQIDDDDIVLGTAHSAPSRFSFGRTALITTLASAAVFAAFYWLTVVVGLGPDSFPHLVPGT